MRKSETWALIGGDERKARACEVWWNGQNWCLQIKDGTEDRGTFHFATFRKAQTQGRSWVRDARPTSVEA